MLNTIKDLCPEVLKNIQLYWHYILGALVALLLLKILCRARNNSRPIKTATNELGELFITKRSLIKLIASLAKKQGVPGVEKIRFYTNKHVLRVKLFIRLQLEQNFEQISVQLQEGIQQLLERYLGMTKTIRVDVIMTGIVKSMPAITTITNNLGENE